MKLLSVMEIRDWAPDLISGDDSSLIEQIRERVLPRRGVWAEADGNSDHCRCTASSLFAG